MKEAKKNKQSAGKKRGSILALAVVMVVIMSLLGLVMVRMGSSARVQSVRTTSDISARAAADAGMTQAVRLMNIKLAAEPGWDNSTLPETSDVALANSRATFSYKVEGEPKAGFQVTSTGKCAFSERIVHGTLKTESLWFGIGVKQNADILSKTIFDTIPAGSDFTIRTNSIEDNAISLYPNTVVPGDVIVGPGGDPDTVINTKKSSIIMGDTYAAEEEIEFPDVTVPALPYKGSLPAADPMDPNAIKLTAANSGIYDSINLAAGQKLHVVDGQVTIYVKGDVRLHNSAELLLLNNATVPSLKLYLGSSMIADNGSLITTENHLATGTRLKIYGTNDCDTIILKNSGDLSAAIYAPYSHLELKNSGAMYGAFTGDSIEIKNSGEFHFDTRLLDITIEEDATYLVLRWWEE